MSLNSFLCICLSTLIYTGPVVFTKSTEGHCSRKLYDTVNTTFFSTGMFMAYPILGPIDLVGSFYIFPYFSGILSET